MYNKNFKPAARFVRASFATFMLLASTFSAAFGQNEPPTLCDIIDDIPITNTTIDIIGTTNTLPNFVTPGMNPTSSVKGAKGRLVLVREMITVTTPFVIFEDCDIRMFSGDKPDQEAGFTVPAGKVLAFKNCRIASGDCEKLWNTIRVSGGILMMTDNNQVEDARRVITMEGSGDLVCQDNNFNRNYMGIFLSNNPKYSRISIMRNTFQKTRELINEANEDKILFGINVINVSYLNLVGNKFKNIACGIFATNSTVKVEGGEFNTLFKNLFTGSAESAGSGIYTSNRSNLTVTGGTYFEKCSKYMIRSVSSKLNCQGASFNQMNWNAISIYPTDFGDNIISNNVFTGNDWYTSDHIYIGRINLGNDIIENNTFTFKNDIERKGGSPFNGITIYADVPIKGIIKGNTFDGIFPSVEEPNAPIRAININNGDNILIRDNIISAKKPIINPSNYSSGIESQGNKTLIQNNSVSSDILNGIALWGSKGSLLCGNRITGTEIGLKIGSSCDKTKIIDNSFKNNSNDGLLLWTFGINLGDQIQHGNIFDGVTANHTGGDIFSSRFFVNNNTSSNCGNSKFMPQSVIPSSSWFIPEIGCSPLCSDIPQPLAPTITEYEAEVIADRLAQYNPSSTQVWEAKYNLYEKLNELPELKSTSSFVNAFFESVRNDNIGNFYNVNSEITKALSDNEGFALNGKAQIDSKEILLQELNVKYNTWLADTTNVQSWTALVNARTQLENTQNAISQYIIQYQQFKSTILRNASYLNQVISPINLFESNFKIINALKIKYFLGEQLSDEDWSIAKQIARICYIDGGLATKEANQLLGLERKYVTQLFDCRGSISGKVKSNTANKAVVFPNPVSEELNIQYSTSPEANVVILIYDISGKLLVNQIMDTQSINKINVSAFRNGFYIVNILENNRLVSVERFVKTN